VRAVVQRVRSAAVTVDEETVGAIDHGLLVLVGVASGDGPADIEYVASKVAGLRVFNDPERRMNLSVQEVGGAILLVSQFTLLGDVRRGRRPSFDGAAAPAAAREAFERLAARIEAEGLRVAQGRFQTHMHVALVNDGPVTILLDSRRTF
jgi:D-tyrosyl-tRNA(Tyr) deacylase